jgi:stage V sporulation protein SpoVS
VTIEIDAGGNVGVEPKIAGAVMEALVASKNPEGQMLGIKALEFDFKSVGIERRYARAEVFVPASVESADIEAWARGVSDWLSRIAKDARRAALTKLRLSGSTYE